MTINPALSNTSVAQQFNGNQTNLIYAISDGANYVAFLSASGIVTKYPILSTGLLNPSAATTVDTVLGTISTLSAIASLPTVYFASGSNVVSVDLSQMTATTAVDVNTDLTSTVTNIVCGGLGSNGDILYASDNGIIFGYSTTGGAPINPPLVTTETFSGACAVKASTYGVFVSSTSRKLYQVSFPGTNTAPAIQYTIENIGQSPQVPGAGATNADQSAFYFPTYTKNGGGHPDNIYEFALFPNQVDFYSVTQPDVTDIFFVNPVAFSPQYSNVVYIGTNGPLSNFYTFNLRSITYTNSTRLRLYPDYSLPTNPTGPNGKVNAIGDQTQTATNGDLIIGDGLTTLGNQNTSGAIPGSGPVTAYFRGTQSDAPAHGGLANTDSGLSLKLVSLDEVTLPGSGVTLPNNGTTVLIRSIPFFNSDLAPWFISQTIQPSGSSGPTTGYQWSVGNTLTINSAANQYNYMIPPYLSVVNNSLPSSASSSGSSGTPSGKKFAKRDPTNTNQNTLDMLKC
jgi:hypothetical protein